MVTRDAAYPTDSTERAVRAPGRRGIRVLTGLALGLVLLTFTYGTPRALIVVGLTSDPANTKRVSAQAAAARAGFLARGFADDAIRTLTPTVDAPVKRDTVLAAFKALAPAADDETWIVLFGHAAAGRDGRATFQVSGPRVTIDDLAGAVSALPGKKFVVIATERSGGFLAPLLPLKDVEAVAATSENGELNEPRFADAWTDALKAQPSSTFTSLASAAVEGVTKRYADEELVVGEHAQLIDRATGTIVSAPFVREKSATPPP